jgi:DNA polymerase III delta' subunit
VPAKLLSEVIGQPGPTRLLARLIAGGRLPHALLLEGVPGCGRRTLAIAVARALLCPSARGGDACGACASCRLVDEGTHPDLVALSHDSQADDLGVDLVRSAVVEAAYQSPLLGSKRVFVLPGVERLGLAAANTLLKVLEEPPAGAYLVMTTANAGAVLRTIRSRAQLHRLAPLAAADIERILVRGGIPAGEARLRAALGGGSHRGLWQDAGAIPLQAMLRLCREGLRSELVAEIADQLPQRAREDEGRTLAAEQRRQLGQWLQALLHELRGELRGPQAAKAADAIERVLQLQQDVHRNISPQLVIAGLALGAR